MPLLDPGSVVLSSPFLVDSFDVRQRVSVVNDKGRGKTIDTPVPDVPGIVYPEGDQGNKRKPEAILGMKAIMVLTQFPLQSVVKFKAGLLPKDRMPDIVIWAGEEFVVHSAEDYSRIGEGWMECWCAAQTIKDEKAGTPTNEPA